MGRLCSRTRSDHTGGAWSATVQRKTVVATDCWASNHARHAAAGRRPARECLFLPKTGRRTPPVSTKQHRAHRSRGWLCRLVPFVRAAGKRSGLVPTRATPRQWPPIAWYASWLGSWIAWWRACGGLGRGARQPFPRKRGTAPPAPRRGRTTLTERCAAPAPELPLGGGSPDSTIRLERRRNMPTMRPTRTVSRIPEWWWCGWWKTSQPSPHRRRCRRPTVPSRASLVPLPPFELGGECSTASARLGRDPIGIARPRTGLFGRRVRHVSRVL